MSKYFYDLHLHSCLSPCGDDDNTPNNIAGMAKLCGLYIVALTDHNSTKNCPAFFEAARRYEIIPIAGMELTTSEDIHVVCLFETLDKAMAMDEDLQGHRILVKNKVDVFGKQSILDGMDEEIGQEEYYLPNATDISYEDVKGYVERFDGVCFPAHIDRKSNGVVSVLGTLPESPSFRCIEFNLSGSIDHYKEKYDLSDKIILVNSDAHYLNMMRDAQNYIELPDNLKTEEEIVSNLFKLLRGETV